MFRWTALAIACAGVLIGAAACGGGDDKTIDVGDGGKVTIGDDLPDSFPDDFPIYDGADLQTAVEGEQEGIEGLVATWTTGDDFDDVKNFYDDAFQDGPWKSAGEGTAGGATFWTVEKGDQAGYVSIIDGDDVVITAVVGDNPGAASDGDEPTVDDAAQGGDSSSGGGASSDLPDEVELSGEFPVDIVRLPDGARVTSSSSLSAGGAQTHLVVFYSQDSIDDLAASFKDELEGKGYSQSIQTSDESGVYAAYAENTDGTGAIVIVTIAESDVDGYREVGLQVTESQ